MKNFTKRVVIFGGTGFIGSHITNNLRLKEIDLISLGTNNVNLIDLSAKKKLEDTLKDGDVVVFSSALAPCKNLSMFQENLYMIQPLAEVLEKIQLSQLVYISSDAVYKDTSELINEKSCAQPNSLHGAMHLSREIAFQNLCHCPISLVRPTLVYGVNDPHNGYGPNSFARLANRGETINLFGQGEELRDHIAVEDVAEIVSRVILKKVTGVINAVTGNTVTFNELANYISKNFNLESEIRFKDRQVAVPHDGYRAFDNSNLFKLFPDLTLQSWEMGIKKLCLDVKSIS